MLKSVSFLGPDEKKEVGLGLGGWGGREQELLWKFWESRRDKQQ